MKRVVPLPSFERLVKKLTIQEKQSLAESLDALHSFLSTGQISYGFRLKKIANDVYEFRVDIRLRVIAKTEGDTVYLAFIGNHEDIHKFLKNYR